MYSELPPDFDGLPPLSDDPPPLSATPPPLSATPVRATVHAGAGASPPSSETLFCAGRVDWEKPTIKLTADSVSEARLQEIAALTPGQSLRIEAEVPKAEIQKALKQLNPGTHLMLNYIFVDNDDSDSEEDQATYLQRVDSLEEVVKCIPSGITIHIHPNTDIAYVEALNKPFGVSLTFALRGQPKSILIDVLSDSSYNITYSILPEHSIETARSIVHRAAKTGGAICFEEGVSEGMLYFSVALEERPKIALPIPSVWSMKSVIDEWTCRRPVTLVPHSSTTVEEMQRLARMCQAGKCELALDARHTKAQVIAVANSLPCGARLFLSTDEQDLRLQVAKRMPPESQLHLMGIKSVKEISDILAVSQETVNVVLPVSVNEHIIELQRKSSESGYKITTNSDGSFGIRKEPLDMPTMWMLPPEHDLYDPQNEDHVINLTQNHAQYDRLMMLCPSFRPDRGLLP